MRLHEPGERLIIACAIVIAIGAVTMRAVPARSDTSQYDVVLQQAAAGDVDRDGDLDDLVSTDRALLACVNDDDDHTPPVSISDAACSPDAPNRPAAPRRRSAPRAPPVGECLIPDSESESPSL